MASPVIKHLGPGQPLETDYGYTQVVKAGDTVYLSGQRPVDANGQLVHSGDFAAQAKAMFANIDKCLATVGAKRSHVVNERVFIVDVANHISLYEAARKQFFGDHRSASTTIGVPGLALKDQLIEVTMSLRLDMGSTKPDAPVVKRFVHDLPHEESFGYTQVLQVGNTVTLSGQLSHNDEGQFIGSDSFQAQIDQTYANIDKCITAIGGTRSHIVNEHVFIVDSVKNAPEFAIAHKQYYGAHSPTSTLIGVASLYFPVQLLEISITLQLDIDSVELKRFAHGLPLEEGYGYTQALQVGETVYISGQLALDENEQLVGKDDFQAQIECTYKNLDRCLAAMGATRNQIVVEDVFLVDSANREALFRPSHRQYYGNHRTTSNVIGVPGLYYPEQLIEIAVTVRLDIPK